MCWGVFSFLPPNNLFLSCDEIFMPSSSTPVSSSVVSSTQHFYLFLVVSHIFNVEFNVL